MYHIKKVFFTLLSFASIPAFSQQLPQYTQYIFSNFLRNPALSGIENYTELKTGYRKQWTGIDEAPETSYLSIHAPIGNGYLQGSPTSFPGGENHPMSRSFVSSYSAAEPHHGIGLHLISDKAGPFRATDLQAKYAYHLGLSPKLSLAVGAGAGIMHIYLDKNRLRPENMDDARLMALSNNQFSPQISVGTWLYSPTAFFGLSANHVTNRNISTGMKRVPHYFATGGYKLFIAEEIALMPSVLISAVQRIYSVDCNAKLAFKDKFWTGISYRNKNSVSALAGFNISSLFNLSYSYDYSTSNLQQVNSGSHEIVLGLLLNNKYRVVCPQNQF